MNTLKIILTVGALCVAAAGCDGPRTTLKPSLGTLVHRQSSHQLRDLLDPAYRAGCADPAIRTMKPEESLAGKVWAGK